MTDVHEMLSGFLSPPLADTLCNYSLKCSGEVFNLMNIRLLIHCFLIKAADDMTDYLLKNLKPPIHYSTIMCLNKQYINEL